MHGQFTDRLDAGHQLAGTLQPYKKTRAVVVGLARGGVIVAGSVAHLLHLPLRALAIRKLGAPQNPEMAIGAISETGSCWLDQVVMAATGASDSYVQSEKAAQVAEAQRLSEMFTAGLGTEIVRDVPAIVVDDGIATGATALVGAMSAKDLGASEVVVASPVASRRALGLLRRHADDIVVLTTPDPFLAVGLYYRDFDQVTDAEVLEALCHSRREM